MSERMAASACGPGASGVVAVLGGGGFLGTAVVSRLRARGVAARVVATPRLNATPQTLAAGVPTGDHAEVVDALAVLLDGAAVVINAAGVADPAAADTPALYGANALLPVLAARACARVGVHRLIHVSSIAVQGDGDLDETARTAPFSPYSRSRALGEILLLGHSDLDTVIFRPTSVHGGNRAVTRSLIRFARSGMSCVAGNGNAPTPQVLVGDVADALGHLALAQGPVPSIVIQPPNGMTTGLLLRLLGGREPRHLPYRLARDALRGIRAGARYSLRATAHTRRVEMLLFGRRQVPGWLSEHGLAPVLCGQDWQRLGSLPATITLPQEPDAMSAVVIRPAAARRPEAGRG